MRPPFSLGEIRTVIELARLYGPHGESQIKIDYDGEQLCIKVDLNDESLLGKDYLQLIFENVVEFHVAAVPGVYTLNFEHTGKICEQYELGDVVECTQSEAADAWSSHFGWKIRHFGVLFTSENKSIIAFARDCRLES